MSNIKLTPLRKRLQAFAPQGRTALLPALHATQALYGYIPEAAAEEIGAVLGVPFADVYGVIEFYDLLYDEPVGETIVHVCTDPACAMKGGETVLQALQQYVRELDAEMEEACSINVRRAPCLGLCEHAPAVLVDDIPIAKADPSLADNICEGIGGRPTGIVGGDIRILTKRCGIGSPAALAEYEADGGYRALRKALQQKPQDLVAEVKASGLLGRGGAAFPTGLKWEGAANAQGDPKYVVCNADESEIGTFKDRVLLEEDPHQVIEGTIISAYAIGAHKGYMYVRGEYPYSFRVVNQAVKEAQQAGYIGKDILGSGFDFDLELRLGAGAYICGEETAMFESIEGKRGFPRLKPPFPTTHGLFGQPTAINNVETLCNIPYIIEHGAVAFRKYGTEQSPGAMLFCLSGDVERPGIYEAPMGVPLRHLIEDLAGGVINQRKVGAVLVGGAAGSFATAEQLDVPMSFEGLREAGLSLGSGVVMVFDDSRDLRETMLQISRFFAHESCGKCYPCQIGTQRQYEILQRVASQTLLPGDIQRLVDVGQTMRDASICGLGQTAANAILSGMKYWPELFDANGNPS